MGFTEAIRVVLFKKYATFSGRASRSEFWWFVLFYIIISLIFSYLCGVLFEDEIYDLYVLSALSYFTIIASAIFDVVFFLPAIAVTVRRLHDRNLSGMLAIAPAIISIISFVLSLGVLFPEYLLSFFQLHSSLKLIFIVIYVFLIIICLVIIVIAILKGTNGSNRYGLDPLQTRVDAHIFE